MLKCLECNRIIDDDDLKTVSEQVGEYAGAPYFEHISVCPHCGCDLLEEVKPCAICGEFEKVVENIDVCYCEECKDEILNRFTALINREFSEAEQKIIKIAIEEAEVII